MGKRTITVSILAILFIGAFQLLGGGFIEKKAEFLHLKIKMRALEMENARLAKMLPPRAGNITDCSKALRPAPLEYVFPR